MALSTLHWCNIKFLDVLVLPIITGRIKDEQRDLFGAAAVQVKLELLLTDFLPRSEGQFGKAHQNPGSNRAASNDFGKTNYAA